MDKKSWFEIGPNAQIDDGVVLGYRFERDSRPLRIGSHAIIRSGAILYTDTTIGDRFSCGHMALIRGGIMIGNRVVVHHKVTLEGNLTIGSGVKIMAHVYIPSRTFIGNMVFIGPNITILNDKQPQRTAQRIGMDGVTIEDHRAAARLLARAARRRLGVGRRVELGSLGPNLDRAALVHP